MTRGSWPAGSENGMDRGDAPGYNTVPIMLVPDQPSKADRLGAVIAGRRGMPSKKKTAPRKPPAKRTSAGQVEEVAATPRFDSRTFLTSVGAGRLSAAVQPKEIVYRQGDPADAVYYIEAGKIQLTVVSEQGKEGVIAMLEPGEFFGEGCIVGQPFRMASASATAHRTSVKERRPAPPTRSSVWCATSLAFRQSLVRTAIRRFTIQPLQARCVHWSCP